MSETLSVAMLAKALISSGADSVHVHPGEPPQLTHGLTTRAIADVPVPGADDVRRLCAALLPAAKLVEIEHGKRKRLKCHIGQLGAFHVEIGAADGAFTLVLSPVVGVAEIEAALGRAPVVESSAHALREPEPLPPPPPARHPEPAPERAFEPPPVPPRPSPPVRTPGRRMAIFLALAFGSLGLHYFYLGRRVSGWLSLILWIATGGLSGFLLGTLACFDAIRMIRMTDEAFLREMVP